MSRHAPAAPRAAAATSLLLGVGFGIPGAVGLVHRLRTGHVWQLFGYPTYGNGPFERVGLRTTAPLLVAFLAVCLVKSSSAQRSTPAIRTPADGASCSSRSSSASGPVSRSPPVHHSASPARLCSSWRPDRAAGQEQGSDRRRHESRGNPMRSSPSGERRQVAPSPDTTNQSSSTRLVFTSARAGGGFGSVAATSRCGTRAGG